MHFPVTVITEDGDYDSVLAPYSENIQVAPHIDRTKAEVIEEKREEWSWAQKEENKKLLEYLKSTYDWADDESLFKSIVKRGKVEGIKYDREGNRLTTYNPQSKWDWYQLGGRWANFLHIKGKRWRANESRVKNIDFKAYSLPEKEYYHCSRTWQVLVEELPLRDGERKEDFGGVFENKDSLLADYGDYDTYMKCMNSYFTWNLLYNGVWYQPNDNSLICNDQELNKKYLDTFFSIISQLNPEHYIAVVDCHI